MLHVNGLSVSNCVVADSSGPRGLDATDFVDPIIITNGIFNNGVNSESFSEKKALFQGEVTMNKGSTFFKKILFCCISSSAGDNFFFNG